MLYIFTVLMKSAMDLHIEAVAMCMVTIVLFLSRGSATIQTSSIGNLVLNSDILLVFFFF